VQRLRTWQLFAGCVLIWGTTWHAITYQLSDLAPEFGVAVRYVIAGGSVVAFALWRGERLRFPLAAHATLALQGAFLYGVSYICVYHAERYVASGLVAVGYSASPLLNGLGAAALFGVAIGGRFIVGSILGLAGVAFMFWPEIARPTGGERGTLGFVFTVASVLLSAIGSLSASRNRARGLPLLPAMGFGMLYGAAAAAVTGLVLGRGFALPTAPSWWLSLAWLAHRRIGAGLRLLPDAAGPARPRPGRHRRRDDAAAGAPRLAAGRGLPSRPADALRPGARRHRQRLMLSPALAAVRRLKGGAPAAG
jgi:drug/metabolite transporter (DMT)-like permease